MAVDVCDEASVSAMIGAAVARFGRVDILVNNAAMASNTPPVPLADLTVAHGTR